MMLGVCLWVAVARVSRQADQVHAQTAQVVVAADAGQSAVRRDGDGSTPRKSFWDRIRGEKKPKSAEQLRHERLKKMAKETPLWKLQQDVHDMQQDADFLERRYAHLEAMSERERATHAAKGNPYLATHGRRPRDRARAATPDPEQFRKGLETEFEQQFGPTDRLSDHAERQAQGDFNREFEQQFAEQIRKETRFGPRVRLTGLNSESELNGELADIVSDLLDGGKLDVQLKIRGGPNKAQNLRTIRVKRDKLEDPHVALGGYRRTHDGSWDLQKEGPDPSRVVRGRPCRVEGTSQDALNGQAGTIQELQPPEDGKPQRLLVKLPDFGPYGELKALKAGNVVLN